MSTAPASAESLRSLLPRFDEACIQAFQGAMSVCASRTHFEVTPEHLMMRLLDDTTGDVTEIFTIFRVDRARVRRAVQQALDELPTGHRTKPLVSPKIVELFQSAAVMADEYGFERLRTGLFILAFVLNPSHSRIGEFTPELERINVDQLRDHFQQIMSGVKQAGHMPGEAPAGGRASGGPGPGGALDKFCIDLTAKATEGKIDPVFARDHEIRQMIDIFARRRKNNPILVGEPGTGKTAVVEGLALRIAHGDVPPTLKGVKLLNLDMGLLQAGASVKGEFENRLKGVINEVKSSEQPIVLFIDEAHQLVGGGGGDAANLLKPALARGELRTCAATTWAEYKKYFEEDPALERRFQLVRCEEPTAADAVVMLRGLKTAYEKHHKVFMTDEAVVAAVNLSKRYISGRFLPDKAVDLLDTTSARVGVSLKTRPGQLEDYDRELESLNTAIAAMQRDESGGMKGDAEKRAEMETERERITKEREKFEQRWQRELEVINEILELRRQLPAFRDAHADEPAAAVAGANGKGADGKSAGKPGEGKTAGDVKGAAAAAAPAPEAPPVDEAAIRDKIDNAITRLREIQGDNPLLHPHVDAAAVATVVSDWTGIPVGSMMKDEIAATLAMEDKLRSRVVGQDHALKLISEKLRISKAGIGDPTQPQGVFLLVGPSGTGKTELAITVADLLFGGEKFITSIAMSEYMEEHSVSNLKGSPKGYVGYGEGGILTEAVRKQPYSVILLDECEKAHKSVLNLFYQVFDKGSLRDDKGRDVNFKNCVFFMTSNLGTDVIQNMCESGEEIDINMLKEAIYPALRDHFKPALVARMTVIPFFTLKREILCQIAKMKTAKVGKRLAEAHKMKFECDDAVYGAIADRCKEVDIGARQVDHILNQQVLPGLSRQLLEQMAAESMPKSVRMGIDAENNFTYTFAS